MRYTFSAIVNYPEQGEIDTPTFKASSEYELMQLFLKLTREEVEATSFVITITQKET